MNLLKIAVKVFLKFILYAFLFIFVTFAICEIWFRAHPDPLPQRYIEKQVRSRLWDVWLNGKNSDILLPPFKVFSNTDCDNMDRLRFIARESSLPKNKKLISYDFLRPSAIKDKTSYTATINNLGFRDPPRTIQKPKNVFRIIVLGSYHAFGFFVNDEDTYPRQLEHILNDSGFNNVHFEVWNGGYPEASAIFGLARLKTDILDYQPDLIIWDYGFGDIGMIGDNNFPMGFLHPDTGIYRPLIWLYHLLKNINSPKFLTFYRFEDYLLYKHVHKSITNFIKVNKKMMEFTKELNIPVILLRQRSRMPTAVYQNLADRFDNVVFVDVDKVFKKYLPSPEAIKEFRSGVNWYSEYDPRLEKECHWLPKEYLTDIFHYNKWGHKAVANYLADKIELFVNQHYLK